LAASGSYALTAAMIGLGVAPGDEVLVPAHTYMASATSPTASTAIPVIVDVNESITNDSLHPLTVLYWGSPPFLSAYGAYRSWP
jgi:dTDP-4-amino-4,6-dideoxygalactose transaminase